MKEQEDLIDKFVKESKQEADDLIFNEITMNQTLTQKKTNCILFHKWNKWEELKPIQGDTHITFKQIRYCKICNEGQGRSITYVQKVK